MSSYGEEKLTYDAIGNPLKYCELTLTWEKGRRLKSVSNGSESVAYTYEYNLLEQITRVKKGTEEIESYTYDNYGNRERGVLFCDGA